MTISDQEITNFQDTVLRYYADHGRHDMPWRLEPSPYYVLVSEIMLQQTQVERVIPKFNEFIAWFPDIPALAAAELSDVLRLWSGLGYNRRAKFLWQAARMVVEQYDGVPPDTREALVTLPGVGQNTAGAILAYAFNQPSLFVETNIRTVFFHHFFIGVTEVHDTEIIDLLNQTLPAHDPRKWYWALMDYGTHLKKTAGGKLGLSKHYKKQSALSGSLREMRGRILRALISGSYTNQELQHTVLADDRYEPALSALIAENMVVSDGDVIRLT